MKKYLMLALFYLPVALSSCNNSNNDPNLVELDASEIVGKLGYVENPFSPITDTILCLQDVQHLYCRTYDAAYCAYLNKMLSKYQGTLYASNEHLSGPYTIEFIPNSNLYFYPIRDGKYISIMDHKDGQVLDSISLPVMYKSGYKTSTNNIVIYITPNGQLHNARYINMGDCVVFQGDDHMQPVFIIDTITPFNNHIICFEASRGPISLIP